MKHNILFFLFLLPTAIQSQAQEKWDLKKCVEYAMEHNLQVGLADIQASINGLNLQQSKWSLYPTLSTGSSAAFNTGNNQDPATFSRVTENYFSMGMQLQSSASVFNFFSKKNQVLANSWDYAAAQANVNKIKYDIALSTANAYLQFLLAHEQEKIVELQRDQTRTQLEATRKRADAGVLPELSVTQLEAQLAQDSSNIISAKGNTQRTALSLKALMNLSADSSISIDTPPVETIPVEAIAELQPDFVYREALQNQPQQIGNQFRMAAAKKMAESMKATMYPSINAFANLSSNYLAFSKRPFYRAIITGYQSTGLVADAGGGVLYDVQSPILTKGDIEGYFKSSSLASQLGDNFRKSFGLSLSVPIFNGGNARINYKKSLLNLQNAQLQTEQDERKLKQDIYLAYNDALVALQKYEAGKKAISANNKAMAFAQKRYEIGALSIFELISTQNNLLRSQLENSINRFDYVFKMKVLEFYKGKGLKL
jgi:outer membrane protein